MLLDELLFKKMIRESGKEILVMVFFKLFIKVWLIKDYYLK